MTQLISTNKQPLLRHRTRSVRRAGGFVQVGLIENEPISKRRLILCPALPVLIFFAIENLRRRRYDISFR
jgi:hypothetical protein